MLLSTRRVAVTKRHALTISRRTSSGGVNLVVEVSHDGVTGLGELAPNDVTGDTADTGEAALAAWAPVLEELAPWDLQQVESVLAAVAEPAGAGTGASARCALDEALHDWMGRRVGQPVWRLLGLDPRRVPLTSLTVGINAPEIVRELTGDVLRRTGARILKVKLGSPDGADADRAILAAAQEAAAAAGRADVAWRVDANGGWTLERALAMLPWLDERGVGLVEQPLPAGQERELAVLYARTPLPLYADESVATAADVARIADRVHGVNLKLQKAGGLREGLRFVHTARAHGLRVMIGCMGETSLSIAAGAQLAPLVDEADLDSHLNLVDDPFEGPGLVDGRVVPGDGPGLGVRWRA